MSPLAIAVNVGSLALVDLIFQYLWAVKVERGYEAKSLNPPMLNNRDKR